MFSTPKSLLVAVFKPRYRNVELQRIINDLQVITDQPANTDQMKVFTNSLRDLQTTVVKLQKEATDIRKNIAKESYEPEYLDRERLTDIALEATIIQLIVSTLAVLMTIVTVEVRYLTHENRLLCLERCRELNVALQRLFVDCGQGDPDASP